MKQYQINIRGKVQGVWFRESARQQAVQLKLHGFARNETNGSVYIEVEGDGSALEAFLAWCRKGPRGAVVEGVSYNEHSPTGYKSFEVR
jgi:acylphosphatase